MQDSSKLLPSSFSGQRNLAVVDRIATRLAMSCGTMKQTKKEQSMVIPYLVFRTMFTCFQQAKVFKFQTSSLEPEHGEISPCRLHYLIYFVYIHCWLPERRTNVLTKRRTTKKNAFYACQLVSSLEISHKWLVIFPLNSLLFIDVH